VNELEPTVSALPLVYEVPPHPIDAKKDEEEDGEEGKEEEKEKEKAAAEKEEKAAKEDEENLAKKVLEASLSELSKLRTSKASTARYENLSMRLLEENPNHLPLLLELLAFAKDVPPLEGKEEGQGEWRAERVGDAAKRILSAVDEAELALYYGRARDDTDLVAANRKAAKKQAKEKGEQRTALRSALLARASAYAPPKLAKDEAKEDDRFKEAVAEMKVWLDSADAAADDEQKDTLAVTLTKYELAMGRAGSALSVLRARLGLQAVESKNGKEMSKDLAALCKELGLDHWATNVEEGLFRKFPVVKLRL